MSKGTSDSKKLTLIYLQQLFLEKTDKTHFIRMPEILDYLAEKEVFVDRRTIYTDLKLLNYTGFEIVGVQEKGGYKYHHPSRLFDTNEIKFLIDSVAASKFLTEKKSKELINKIKTLGSNFDNEALNRSVLLGKRIKSMNDKVLKNLDIIYAALSNNSQITFENKNIYDQITMGTVEPIWQKTSDGQQMLTWIIYPPHFDQNRKYPTLLYCEGGPQSPVSQFWSFRWNFMMMAANDYIIVAPNRRGLPGFGKEWNEQISGDYGGQCMKDYLAAIDQFAASNTFVDQDRLGCVGASFGGFSVYWLAGHHDKRFKAFIAHDGIFNMEMQYLETEEKWFANWDMGGAYWEKNNPIAQRTFANSPHKFVDKWDTPILCIHGEKDYRILANQSMAAFDAAKMRGIPAQLLIFPDENHWVLKPQNGILWQRTFFNWLDKWLKH